MDTSSLMEQILSSDSEKQLNDVVKLLNDVWNNTRMLLNRGFTPKELARENRQKILPPGKTTNIINFDNSKGIKSIPMTHVPAVPIKSIKIVAKINKK